MNKDFIENCKLLKSHFTKLTKAQTNSSQSKFDYESSSAAATINRAEQLLFLDRIDLLDKIDIEDIKQHALLKYTNNYAKNNRLCERNNKFKWNDEIFCTSSIPYNKDKVIIFKDGDCNDEYVIKKEEIFEKYEQMEDMSKILAKKEIDGTEVTVKNISPEKPKTESNNHEVPPKCKTVVPQQKKVNTPPVENGKLIEVKDLNHKVQEQKKVEFYEEIKKEVVETVPVPELKIVPQQQIDIQSVLEVKKITSSDNDDNENINNDKKIEINENATIIKECLEKPQKQNQAIQRNSHSSKINNFIENVEKFQKFNKEKSKSFVSVTEITKTTIPRQNKSLISIHNKITLYQHRYKAQKDIIEMQKEKLLEQNKIIAELKLNKIQIQAKESLENAQKELKKISPVQKHKAKILEEIKKEDDKNREINATLKLSKAPKMLQHMEQRAKEREERRILIKERKRLLEEEKQRILERAMQKKIEDEQLEKQKRLAKLKEQREQIRLAEILKQEMKCRYIEINENAYQHYKKKLKKSAIESFKMVIYRIRIKTEIGIRFYDNNIVIKYFRIWRQNVSKLRDYKTFVVNKFYKKCCLQWCMRVWKNTYLSIIQSNQVAIDRYEMSLQHNTFKAWLEYTRKCKKEFIINLNKADFHYNRILLYKCIHCWRSLPAILAIERVQVERKRKWRLRVAQILTDYDPLKSQAD